MKIVGSEIQMFSKSSSFREEKITEELKVWSDNNEPASDRQDKVTLNDRSIIPEVQQKRSESHEYSSDAEPSGKLLIMKLIIESLTGRKINLKKVTAIETSDELSQIRNNVNNTSQKPDTPQREGWGVIYNMQTSYSENEELSFQAEGRALTSEGELITFNISEQMAREYKTNGVFTIRAGDALIDPLVINFTDTPVGLTDSKYSFDLDSDGRNENISFVSHGSGLLTIDLNADGKVNNGKELFGPETGNGFNELAQYDNDENGWIDIQDSVFKNLKVWTKDGDGNDQLYSLADKKIEAIYIKGLETEFSIKDNSNNLKGQIVGTSIYLDSSRNARAVHQINLVA